MEVLFINELVKQGYLTVFGLYFAASEELPQYRKVMRMEQNLEFLRTSTFFLAC